MSKLTVKQQLFIDEYLKCLNATKAARLAGYKGNYSTLQSVGSENLRKPLIKAEIEKKLQASAMSASEVVSRLGEIARCEYSEFITPEGTVNLKAMKEAGKMHLVKGTKPTKDGMQVMFYDGQKALVDIGRHFSLFTDRVQQETSISVNFTGNTDLKPNDDKR